MIIKVEVIMELRRGKPSRVREVRKNGRRVRAILAGYPDSSRHWRLMARRNVIVGLEECRP